MGKRRFFSPHPFPMIAEVACLLLNSAGKPVTVENIKSICTAGGIKFDEKRAKLVVDSIGEKNCSECIELGRKKIGEISMATAPAAASTAATKASEVQEEVDEEEEESEEAEELDLD